MIGSLLIAAAAYYFFLKKVAKFKTAKMLPLPHLAFALQTGQNHGYAYLPRCRTRLPSLQQNADALPPHRPPSFCPLSPGSFFAVGKQKKTNTL
jgi:hypothetical protein